MKTIKCFLLVAFFALWACQEEQFSQKEEQFDSSRPYPRIERLRTIKRVDNAPATRAVGVKDKFWQPGDTIRIKFQNADEYPELPEKVIQYAAIWLQYANLHFEYVEPNEEADVKIGFDMDDRRLSWSTIGTDCRQVPQDEVSLNFVDLEFAEDEDIQKEVLRGFGHVLGLGFEHRSPVSPITLDEAKALKYFKRQGLSEEYILNDILPYYNSDQTNYTDFDPLSIMVLAMPTIIQTGSVIQLKENNTLSPTDIAFVRDVLYSSPKRTDCLLEISVYGNSVNVLLTIQEKVSIDYGDGVTETYSPGYYVEGAIHEYTDTCLHIVRVFGTNTAITEFQTSNSTMYLRTIHSVKFYQNKALKKIWCLNHEIRSFDLSECPELEDINIQDDSISSINLLQNKKLKSLVLINTKINNIDLSQNRELEVFFCDNNNLTSLDLSNQPALQTFSCISNRLNSIDFRGNPNLLAVSISHNKLQELDITQNRELITLTTSYNKISNIQLSQHQDLIVLHVDSNHIRSLDVSSFNSLRTLYCHNNNFTITGLTKIANDIRDFRLEEGDNWGAVYYNPAYENVTQLFEAKRWHVTNPYSYYRTQDNTFELVKAALARKMDPVIFNRLMELYEKRGL